MEGLGDEDGWTLEGLRDAVVPPSGLRTCSGPALHGLLSAAVESVGPGPFGVLARSGSFLRGLEALLDELALGSVSAATLSEAAGRMGTAGARLAHLARLVESSGARMAATGIELASSRWVTASGVLARGWPAGLGVEQLAVRVAPPCPPGVVGFTAALARAASSSGRTLSIRVPLTGEAGLDAALEPLLQAFEAGPDLPGVELLPEFAEGALSEAVRRLTVATAGSLPTAALEAVLSPGPRQEAAALVDALRRAVEAGAAPDRCALAVLAPEDAADLGRALEDAGFRAGRRAPVPLGTTVAGRVGLAWAGLVARGAPAEDVAWLLRQRLLPALRVDDRLDPLPLLRRAGVRDGALGSTDGASAYEVRLAPFAARSRAAGDLRDADSAERLLRAASALLGLAGRLPGRGRLADLLEAWRAGLEAGGFWTALEREALECDPLARRAAAREAAAVEVWRAFVRDTRAGWKAARTQGPEMDRAAFARWLADAAARLPVELAPGLPGGVDVLLLESLDGRPLDFLGVAGLDATSFPRRAEPSLLGDEERQAIHEELGRVALPSFVGSGEARSALDEAVDCWRLGRALASAGRVAVARRRGAGGAPADVVQRLLDVTGTAERDLSSDTVPLLADAPGPGWARLRLALEASAAPDTRSDAPDPVAHAALGAVAGAPWLETARALAAIEAERLQVTAGLRAPGAHSGRLGPATDVVAAVEARLGGSPEGPLSSTSLTALANCPFQGLSRKVLGLDPPEDGTEELDARARGQFLHQALEQLVKRLLELGLTAADPATLPEDLVPLAVEAAAREHGRHAPTGHPRLWALAQARARRTLERLLRSGKLYPFPGLRPAAAEERFGPDLELPAALPGERPVYFRGSLDRIDRGEGGTGVLDYKSSKRRDRARAEVLVTDFQLPLYLLALRARGERPPFQAGWLSLRTLEFLPLDADRTGPLDTFLATDTATRASTTGPNLATAVHALLTEPRAGLFPVRPRECGFCPLGSVCRISERRAPQGAEG
ncbi:MAG TPA: PD-(D/E)XK nuclease family protein [Myxococcaceae bacterium]|nr:PD-(D/E)XK nuclease family protein [Myxococcaceae bacterium]